ncbi:MAG: pirin-like C-terminal cupin domain-containing protein [Acidobacteriota bacterium]
MKPNRPARVEPLIVTAPVRGRRVEIGTGFSALSFDHTLFDGLMDPLLMVDHFTMGEPTFGPHPHAGMSAVSVLFEDSRGFFHNRDSLGHDVDLGPGDLYWLKAARGAVHDEGPRPGSRTHALQVFVNLPAAAKHQAPDSLLVRAEQMPELRGEGSRVRVVLGASHGVSGATSPALPLTLLDVHLDPGGGFAHHLPAGHHAWIHAVRGGGQILVKDTAVPLESGHAVAVRGPVGDPLESADLVLRSEAGAQFALLGGQPIAEPIVQRGPFVMNSREELAAAAAAYAAGEFGSID